jgi:hypothetical protein
MSNKTDGLHLIIILVIIALMFWIGWGFGDYMASVFR